MEVNQTELLMKLAEKYEDFQLLVQACVKLDKMDHLKTLIYKYRDQVVFFILVSHLKN